MDANAVRGSTMVTSYPNSLPIGASAWLMCTAPVITSRGGGTWTVRKNLPCGVSSAPLFPLRMCFSSSSLSGSRPTSAALTSRCSPFAISVTSTTAWRAARSALSVRRVSRFTSLVHLLHVDPDGAAAGEADLPGGLVGNAEFQRLGLAALDDIHGFGHHGALDTAAGHGAQEVALVVDHEIGAHRPRRRAPGFHHRGKGHATAGFAPVFRRPQDVFIACKSFHLRLRSDVVLRDSCAGSRVSFCSAKRPRF